VVIICTQYVQSVKMDSWGVKLVKICVMFVDKTSGSVFRRLSVVLNVFPENLRFETSCNC